MKTKTYVKIAAKESQSQLKREEFRLFEPEAIIKRIEKGRFTFESSLAVLAGLAWQEGLLDLLDQPAG